MPTTIDENTTLQQLSDEAKRLGVEFITIKMNGLLGYMAGVETPSNKWITGSGKTIAEALRYVLGELDAILQAEKRRLVP